MERQCVLDAARDRRKCPPRGHAARLGCDAPPAADAIDWNRREDGSLTRHPFSLKRPADFPFAAFLWCEGKNEAIAELVQRLWEVRAANEFCPALPWASLPVETRTQREHARWTVAAIALGGERASRDAQLARVDRMVSSLSASARCDSETTRLYKASLDDQSEGGPRRALAERIGLSAAESCKRLRINNVSFEHGDAGRQDEDSGDGDDVDGGAVTPAAARPVRTVRLSVSLASPADFAPLRRYLCEVGCQVDVLPYGSLDPRLRACF